MSANRPLVLGYYPAWDSGLPPSKIDYRLYTHLAHAFAAVNGATGALTVPDRAVSQELCARAHAAGVKVVLSVGGAESDTSLNQATKAPGGIDRLADHLVAATRAVGYDGLDIDWEFPTDAASQERMVALVRAVRRRLPGAVLSMAVPALDWNGRWFEREGLALTLDFVNVMLYDFHGPWTKHAGHNAPIGFSPQDGHAECRGVTIESSLTYWLKQKRWPKEKLLFGIPLYGRGFPTPHLGGAASGDHERSYVPYRDIRKLQTAGWRRTWDAAAQAPYLQNSGNTEVISYDDLTSVKRKAQYAREAGVAGVFFWEITQDFDGKTNPLVRAARAGLTG